MELLQYIPVQQKGFTIMLKIRFILAVLFCTLFSQSSMGIESTCKQVRFSDVGWTDIAVTTAVVDLLLSYLGYPTKVLQLSVPITFVSLKNADIDVFLGDWMPSMAADVKPYLKDGSIQIIGTLLKNARYTLAVPEYVYQAGVRSFVDLDRFKDRFKGKVFGIEAGNDGNRLIQKMIKDKAFGLGDWQLVESSEQAMLMTVYRAAKKQEWVVFLGWEPHPMNKKIAMHYLKGGDAYFGPNEGSASVHINIRKNFEKICPTVVALLKNLSFPIEKETELMRLMLDQHLEPKAAAAQWLKQNPELLSQWLKTVTTHEGKSALQVVMGKL